jgi:phage-related protein
MPKVQTQSQPEPELLTKPIEFRGSALKDLRDFPKGIRETEQTSPQDIELAKTRFKQLVNDRTAAKQQKGKP